MGFVNGRHYTAIRVRYAETDRMGVAYNSHHLTWFEVGRTELLRDLGFPYREFEQAGIMLPVREAGVKYLKPAFYDDVLTVVTSIKRKPGVRVFIEYEILKDGETIATGFTEHVFTDNGLHPVKPPKTMLDRLSETWQKKVVHDGEEP
jgi:acyl-CoA thioester hydrolase